MDDDLMISYFMIVCEDSIENSEAAGLRAFTNITPALRCIPEQILKRASVKNRESKNVLVPF